MRICVLQCGPPPHTLPGRSIGYGHMFQDLLSEPGQTWDVHPVESGSFPNDIVAHDRFVITGSRHSVHDDLPWITTLMDLIREIHGRERPLLGVCFGHQAIAQALGGLVSPNPKGWDMGTRKVSLSPEAGLFTALSSLPDPFRILESHQDEVVRLPPGARHLARSDFTEHEMMFVEPSVLSMQGHPEFDSEVVRAIIEDRRKRGIISSNYAQDALRTLSVPPDRAALQRLLRGFLRTGNLK
jgi:GMP synthase-like glutamine amidotransferase